MRPWEHSLGKDKEKAPSKRLLQTTPPLPYWDAIPSVLLASLAEELAASSNSDTDPREPCHLVRFNEYNPLPSGIQHMQGADA